MRDDDRPNPIARSVIARGGRKGSVNSLVAAAAILSQTTSKFAVTNMEWQREAWAFYESTPELQFAVSWLSNACSRVRLVPAIKMNASQEPVPLTEDDPNFEACWAIRDQLAGGATGQSHMMADFAVHLSVPGVCYLVGEQSDLSMGLEAIYDPTAPKNVEWVVYSSDELRVRTTGQGAGEGTQYEALVGPDAWRPLDPNSLVVKMWRPNRRWHWMSDSPVRSCLPVLRELAILSQYIDATATSRLAGAGLLFVPTEVQFPDLPDQDENTDSFTMNLIEAMTTPIREPDNAARVVPLVVRVPSEYINSFKHMTFDSPFDVQAMALRHEAIERFATGMDVPAEVVTGLGDVNHWGQWSIGDSAVRFHVSPIAEIVCHALTLGYYQPALQDTGIENAQYCMWYDVSELEVVPDKPANALHLYDRQLIGAEVLRDVTGFDAADAMDDKELRDSLLLQILNKMPEMAGILLPALGIDDSGLPELPLVVPKVAIKETGPTVNDDVDGMPSDNTSPAPPAAPASGGTPDTDQAGATPPGVASMSSIYEDALMAACDGLVYRALEKVGNRIRSQLPKADRDSLHCHAWDVHTAIEDVSSLGVLDRFLEDVWDRSDEVGERYDVNPATLRKQLHSYTRALLAAGEPHEYHRMVTFFGGDGGH